MSNFGWRISGRIVAVVHGEKGPAAADWQRYVHEMTLIKRPELCRGIVYSLGGRPDERGRQELVAAFRGAQMPVAIVTDSLAARVFGVAAKWMNGPMRVFPCRDMEGALGYLQLNAEERVRALSSLHELSRELALPQPSLGLLSA